MNVEQIKNFVKFASEGTTRAKKLEAGAKQPPNVANKPGFHFLAAQLCQLEARVAFFADRHREDAVRFAFLAVNGLPPIEKVKTPPPHTHTLTRTFLFSGSQN
jgi:hypothetical protein